MERRKDYSNTSFSGHNFLFLGVILNKKFVLYLFSIEVGSSVDVISTLIWVSGVVTLFLAPFERAPYI